MVTTAAPLHWTEPASPLNAPRRRRSGCCAFLRMDGAPTDYAQMREAGVKFRTDGSAYETSLDRHVWTCPGRPTIQIGTGWVNDLCTSSWNRDCEFRPEPEPPTPTETTLALVQQVRDILARRSLSMKQVSLAMGANRTYVGQAVGLRRATALVAIIAWLEQEN